MSYPHDLDPGWQAMFDAESQKPYFKELSDKINQEYRTYRCYPPAKDVYNAFRYTPLDQVRVVILGQDPYHGYGQAQGLAFSVHNGQKLPPSLQNIAKEVHDELGTPLPQDRRGSLVNWTRQGVLLLNTSLTVREHCPNSHADFGWSFFTDEAIKTVNAKNDPVVFILWGAHARKKASLIDKNKHVVLESAHPSPFSARNGFFGSGCFKKTNDFLVKQGKSPIDWTIGLCD